MAGDEAVVRVILDSTGQQGAQPASAPAPPPPQPPTLASSVVGGAFTPTAAPVLSYEDRARREAAMRALGAAGQVPPARADDLALVKALTQQPLDYQTAALPTAPPAPSTGAADDDYERRRREREEARRKRDEEEKRELEDREKEFWRGRGAEPTAPPSKAEVPTGISDEEFARRRAERAAKRKRDDEERLAEIARERPYDPAPKAEVPTTASPPSKAEVQTATPAAPPLPQPTASPPPKAEVPAQPTSEREKLEAEIARREAQTHIGEGGKAQAGPHPLSASGKRLAELKEQLAALEGAGAEVEPPEPTFDPVALAKKRVEAEERRQAVEREYRKLKPQPVKSGMDAFLESIEGMRGSIASIGGAFGRVAAVVLDITARVRQIRAKAVRDAEELGLPPPPPALPAAQPTATTPPPPAPTAAAQAPPVAQVAPTAPQAVPVQNSVANAPVAKIAPAPPIAQVAPSPVPAQASGASAPAAAAGGGLGAGIAAAVPYVAIAAVVVGAVKELVGALNRTAERYAEYNPQIAQAQAMAEVRQVMGDMRRAQRFAPELAKFIQEQSRMQQSFEEVKIRIWMEITPILTSIMKGVSWIVEKLGFTEDEEDKIEDPTSIILNPEKIREVREGATIPLSIPADIIR